MFIMLSLEIKKHKEGKLSVSASVTKWVSDLVPVFVHFLISKLRKSSYIARSYKTCCETWVMPFFVCGVYSPVRSLFLAGYPRPCYTTICASLLLSAWGECSLVFRGWGCCCCGYQTESAMDQRVSGGRQLHLFPSTCQPKCVYYLTSEWCLFSQQLQMRLQEKEKEVDDLTIQIQAEKVVSFFRFPLPAPPSSSVEPQIVQNMGLYLQTITF